MLNEGGDFFHDAIKEAFSFFRGREVRMTDNTAFRDFVELVDEKDGAAVLHVGLTVSVSVSGTIPDRPVHFHTGRIEMEHDRRFHLTRMSDAAEVGFADFS